MGKFLIKRVPSGVKFNLKATNGVVLCMSEVYASMGSCRKGIESVKKNAVVAGLEDQTEENTAKVKCPKFQVYTDKRGETRFRLLATNGQVIVSSGEGYTTKAACLNGVESVRKNVVDAAVEMDAE